MIDECNLEGHFETLHGCHVTTSEDAVMFPCTMVCSKLALLDVGAADVSSRPRMHATQET